MSNLSPGTASAGNTVEGTVAEGNVAEGTLVEDTSFVGNALGVQLLTARTNRTAKTWILGLHIVYLNGNEQFFRDGDTLIINEVEPWIKDIPLSFEMSPSLCTVRLYRLESTRASAALLYDSNVRLRGPQQIKIRSFRADDPSGEAWIPVSFRKSLEVMSEKPDTAYSIIYRQVACYALVSRLAQQRP